MSSAPSVAVPPAIDPNRGGGRGPVRDRRGHGTRSPCRGTCRRLQSSPRRRRVLRVGALARSSPHRWRGDERHGPGIDRCHSEREPGGRTSARDATLFRERAAGGGRHSAVHRLALRDGGIRKPERSGTHQPRWRQSGEVSARLATSDDTATAGVHYKAIDRTIVFRDGVDAPVSIDVPVINDTVHGGNKTLNLTVTARPECATLGSVPQTTLTIVDDEELDDTRRVSGVVPPRRVRRRIRGFCHRRAHSGCQRRVHYRLCIPARIAV